MLTHLYNSDAKITLVDLEQNDTHMKTDLYPNQPFEVLIDQTEEGVDYAMAGANQYTSYQIVNIVYNLVLKAGFLKTNEKIQTITSSSKTWTRFKTDFTEAH